MISAHENVSNPRLICQKNSLLFWQRCCWLSLWNLVILRTVTCLFSKRLIWPSHISLLCFCPNQTLTCAAPVTVVTSEGSALGLYLERWPSPSAAVPAQSMPTENPANHAHHKIPVCIFESHTRRPLIENTSVTVTCTDTAARRSQCCVIKQRKSLLERQSHISKHTNTLIQKSLSISPVYFHINRLQRCYTFGKTFVWLNENVRTCIIARSYMSALRSRRVWWTLLFHFCRISLQPSSSLFAPTISAQPATEEVKNGSSSSVFGCYLTKQTTTKQSHFNEMTLLLGASLLAWCLAGSSWPSQISTSAPSTPKSARTACVRTCWGRTNAPATKAMRWTWRAKTALVGGPLFNLLFENEKENPFSVFVLLLRYGRVPDKQAAVWERSVQEHTGQLHLPVPQRIHLQSKDGHLRGWVAASSAHVCHLRPTNSLFWSQQMWTSVSQTPVSMESAGTAKGPLCVCVLWAVLWTTLAWSV